MSKHTKGPWKVRSTWHVEAQDNEDVVEIRTMYRTKEEVAGNASLVAAAPELLEEVKTLIHILEKGTETPEDLEGAIDWAKALVAKAEGES